MDHTRRLFGTSKASLAWIGALTLLAAGPVEASSPPADPSIVVEGQRQTPEEIRRAAREFVRKSGIAQGQTPAARWRNPVCAKIVGLHGKPAELVRAKLEAEAKAAGVPLARPGCTGNLAIVFTDDGAGVARAIGRKDPRRTADVPMPTLRSIYQSEAPVRWWYAVGESSTSGVSAGTADLPWTGNASGASVIPSNGNNTLLRHNGSSLVSTLVERGITQATVIVDVEAATGKALDAVAAYVAMVALAEVQPRKDPSPGSILSLFEADSSQIDLSERDRDLLHTLYRLPLDRTALNHRSRLSRGVAAAELADD